MVRVAVGRLIGWLIAFLIALLVGFFVGLIGGRQQGEQAAPSAPRTVTAQNGSERTQAESLTRSAEDFERAQFDDPTHIDNKWLPLKPGTQLVYEGSAIVDEEGRQTRRVVTTVTDLSKVIDGVRTLVISEKDYTAGQLSEPELAFFAQDNAGNVWLVGEYPEYY